MLDDPPAATPLRLLLLTATALVAFAGNSLLCRVALRDTAIDAASFTTLRLLSGALVLACLVWLRKRKVPAAGSWASATALLGYAAGFSFAYLSLSAATGALILFGAVQVTMIAAGLLAGERIAGLQTAGLLLALGGLVALLLPGLERPPLGGAALMLAAGVSWGVYSLRGTGAGDPIAVTAGNFLRATPLAAALGLFFLQHLSLDAAGVGYAVTSGALTSGLGYAVWYATLPGLGATRAATAQLIVPVLAAFGGVALLGEVITPRLIVASLAILGGVGVFIMARRTPHRP